MNEIKSIRTQLRLSYDDFGKLMGVTGRTVRRWESGERKFSEMVLKLAKELLSKHRMKGVAC